MPLLKQCLGVDLGFNTVKIVELALDKKGVRVLRAESAPTGATPGMADDEVRQAIAMTAREVLKKGRFSSRKAIFTISGQKIFTRRFRLPKTSDERLARIIQYEARQQIPFPLDKTILQYQHRELADEGEVEVLLAAVRIDEVRDFMALAAKTGLTPIAIGVSSFAVFNALEFVGMDEAKAAKLFDALSHGGKAAGPKAKAKGAGFQIPKFGKKGKAEPEPEAAPEEEAPAEFAYEEVRGYINLGATTMDLAVGRGRVGEMVLFNRTIPLGGNEMTKAIQRRCSVESFHDAERIKTTSTQLMSYNFDFESEGQLNEDASAAATEVADRIVTEIRRSLDFYITQPDGMAIDSVILGGGLAQMKGIDTYLEEKLTMNVSIANQLPADSPLRWPDTLGAITTFLPAIGLALQGMGIGSCRVDFLPEERKITRDFPYRVAAVMAAVVGGTVFFASQAGNDYSVKYGAAASSLEGEYLKNFAQSKRFTDAQAEQQDIADKFLGLNKAVGQRDYWIDVLTLLAEARPPGITIVDIETGHDGSLTVVAQSEQSVDAATFNSAIKEKLKGRTLIDPEIDDIVSIAGPAGSSPLGVQRFTIKTKMIDKVNHLKITPTPVPTARAGAQPGGGFTGFEGDPTVPRRPGPPAGGSRRRQ